jgi:ABC-2 type transport system permease protein
MINDIYTIWFRQVKKALKDKWQIAIGITWILLLIFIIGYGIDSFINLDNYDISYTEIFGSGMIAMIALQGALTIGNDLIEDKKGFIKELLVSPISRVSIFVGLIFGNMTMHLLTSTIIIVIFLAIVASIKISAILLSLLIIFLIAFGFYGFGIVFASLFKSSKSLQMVSSILIGLVVLLSGAFYPIDNLPGWIKILVSLNPLTYGVDALRYVMIGFSEYSLAHSLTVLVTFGFAMLLLGSYLFKKTLDK